MFQPIYLKRFTVWKMDDFALENWTCEWMKLTAKCVDVKNNLTNFFICCHRISICKLRSHARSHPKDVGGVNGKLREKLKKQLLNLFIYIHMRSARTHTHIPRKYQPLIWTDECAIHLYYVAKFRLILSVIDSSFFANGMPMLPSM